MKNVSILKLDVSVATMQLFCKFKQYSYIQSIISSNQVTNCKWLLVTSWTITLSY